MSSFVRRSFALIFFAAFIGARSAFGDDQASENPQPDITTSSHCPKGADCSFIGEFDRRHIHLGTYDGLDRKPLVITVHKSNLKERRVYAVTALSDVGTGNEWMSIGILNEEEHKEVKGHHQKYYKNILTEMFMKRTIRVGVSAHGIETLAFAPRDVTSINDDMRRLVRDEARVQSEALTHVDTTQDGKEVNIPPEFTSENRIEVSKGSIIIHPDAMEGKYYLDFAYGNPFGGPKMVCFKEVIVKVLP
ncbi:hypothetical protein BBBOND_0110810 [Babesia bigemina]|uniref:Uncharacterized protein n=1 Tax=Babesia bigemina TaxID=5866 RepID=A0A061D7A8_BABBI|nr:hypothetical protein BBBOND_0110810 [Babesia bigemina]CDR94784.1 hypothetical protein BBBOND_0110810 [Babesia bigemina]|eukprot:XP_012766970.1 hypothetical protein BBBOND_0110810 [Babesia bigemina]